MENKGLLFIPDISGFTRFVNKVDIEHGRLIIQELLEILVNANEIGLEISEIEGDAILFYKYGDSPDLDALYKQVEKMFCEFHQSLMAYDMSKYCQCNACTSAIDLTLKVITHYGEFMHYQVRDFKKLIGKDIIVAHQLLKNDILQHEYWLVTNNLTNENMPAGLVEEMEWHTSIKHTDNGDIPYKYAPLTGLKRKIGSITSPSYGITDKVKVLSTTRDYQTDIITLFRASGMFQYRHQWEEGVKIVEELNHYLPRVGMRCRVIRDSGTEVIYSSNFSFSPDRIEFSETNESQTKSTNYILEKINDSQTRLTMDFYMKKNFLNQLFFQLSGKNNKEEAAKRSMDKLDELIKVIEFPY